MNCASVLLKHTKLKTGDFSNSSSVMPVFSLTVRQASLWEVDSIGPSCQPKQWNYILRSSWYSESTRPSVERGEEGIRFTSPEIRHTGGAVLVRPPPGLVWQSSFTPPTTPISPQWEDRLCPFSNLISLIPKSSQKVEQYVPCCIILSCLTKHLCMYYCTISIGYIQ